MEHYSYEPIDLEKPAIRLLRLCKGQEVIIECDLFQAFLDEEDRIEYEALSYTWGGTVNCASILVSSKTLGITDNLFLALQHLRSPDADRILWVDAVCINQGNDQERGHQVQQMGDIYSRAHQVIFWLGAATDDTDFLMDSLKRLEEESIKHPCKKWKLVDERWEELWSSIHGSLETQDWKVVSRRRRGLMHLFRQPWFTRIWILQEVAKAKKAVVCSGFKFVSARIFALAPVLLATRPEDRVQVVLDIMPGPSREDSWWGTKQDLQTLLTKFHGSNATDPRDRIFALLGMASNIHSGSDLKADYTKTFEQVLSNTAATIVVEPESSYDTIEELVADGIKNNERMLSSIVNENDENVVAEVLRRMGDGVEITEKNLKAAASKATSKNEVLSLLLGHVGEKFEITERFITDSAKTCETAALEILFAMRNDDITISDAIVVAAASNRHSGDSMMNCLLAHRSDEIDITERVLITAARNTGNGHEIMRTLLAHRSDTIRITENVLVEVAGNEVSGHEIMCNLLAHQKDEITVTEKVLKAAAENRGSGQMLMNTLLDHLTGQKGQIDITEDVMIAAIKNNNIDHTVISTLLAYQEDGYKFSKDVFRAATWAIPMRDAIVKVLTAHTGAEITIRETPCKKGFCEYDDGELRDKTGEYEILHRDHKYEKHKRMHFDILLRFNKEEPTDMSQYHYREIGGQF